MPEDAANNERAVISLHHALLDRWNARDAAKVRGFRLLNDDVAVLRAVVGMVPPGKKELDPALNAVQTMVAERIDNQRETHFMKRTLAATCLLMLFSLAAAYGQTSNSKPSPEDRTRSELMQLERDIGKANVDNDYAFFERVEAEEFIFTDAGGGVTTRKQDLEGLKQPPNPDSKLVAYDVDEMKVLLYDKTAVLTGRVTTKRVIKGAENISRSRFTDVFVWREGRWQIVAEHSSRIRQQ